LRKSKEDRQGQDQDGDPKSIPLHAIAPVEPPPWECTWALLIEDLLQYHQTIVPEYEVFDMSVVSTKVATLYESWIDFDVGRELFEPHFGLFVWLREEEGNGLKGFVGEAVGKDRAVVGSQ
jgi:hypothetical protein